jgi:hypothetical protein
VEVVPVISFDADSVRLAPARIGGRGLDVVDVEFEPGLGDGQVVRPGVRAEARLRGLREGPEGEGLGPRNLLGVEVAVGFLERQAELVPVKSETRPLVPDDRSESRDE